MTLIQHLNSLVGSEITWRWHTIIYKGTLIEVSGEPENAVLSVTNITASLHGEPVEAGTPEVFELKVDANNLVFPRDLSNEYQWITLHGPSNPQQS